MEEKRKHDWMKGQIAGVMGDSPAHFFPTFEGNSALRLHQVYLCLLDLFCEGTRICPVGISGMLFRISGTGPTLVQQGNDVASFAISGL